MPLSYSRGEMYPHITATHNPIKGACWNILHGYGCRYCHIGLKDLGKSYYSGPLHLVEKELEVKYSPGRVYFIGSAVDMFHPNVSDDDIGRVLSHCDLWSRQTPASAGKPQFIFQSKNPGRLYKFTGELPFGSTLATTYETDDMDVYGDMSRAPSPPERLAEMEKLQDDPFISESFKFMLSIEPVMKWTDLDKFVDKIVRVHWDRISIGADSCEAIPLEKQPTAGAVTQLAMELTHANQNVMLKSNCVNLAKNPRAADWISSWDKQGWIYHRKKGKAKPKQGELF